MLPLISKVTQKVIRDQTSTFLNAKNLLCTFQYGFRNKYQTVSGGVPKGSILGPLLIFIYVNDMSQAVKCHLFLYADNSYLVCVHKDINEIQK